MSTVLSHNPASIENRYGMDMACFLVQQSQPRSVHIATPDPNVALMAARRLAQVDLVTVETQDVANTVADVLGINFSVGSSSQPDVVLVPFTRQFYARPPSAHRIVVLAYNALSYKSVVAPGKVPDSVKKQLEWIRHRYVLEQRVGLLTPMFMARWTISLLAGPRFAPTHFLYGQKAIDGIYETGMFWWLGYITVLAGKARS